MAYESGHDSFFMGTTAQRNGLTPLLLAAGENNFPGNGAPGVGNQVFPKNDCEVIGAFVISEAIANCDEYRFHTTNDPDWHRTMFNKADQTANWIWDSLVAKIRYKLMKGEAFQCELDNDNAAQLEIATFMIANKGDCDIAGQPFGAPPPGSFWAMVTGDTPTVGDTVTRSGLTFTNYTLDRTKTYKVYGARFWSADLYAYRLVTFISDDKPAGVGCDTEICGGPTYWKPFGLRFTGLQGLQADFVSEGADTVIGALLIAEE